MDLNTGEPIADSPPNFPQSELSQAEIIQNANLTPYDYDPSQRMQQMQQQQMMYQQPPIQMGGCYYPGMYGYNNPMTQPGYNYQFNNFMNPPMPPQQFGGTPIGYAGNPAFQYMQAMDMQQQAYTPADYTYFVPGFNTGSRVLLPADAQEMCDRLQVEMMMELEEANVARIERNKEYYAKMGYGMNYYGTPWINNFYADPNIVSKYKKMIEDVKQEAMNARTNLNRNLSKLCHNYLDDEISEEDLDKIYSGHTVTVPGQQIQYDQKYAMLASLVPVDTSIAYQQHSAQVSAEYAKCFEEGGDMNTFLRDCGRVIAADMEEQELHKRRDASNLYQQGGAYRTLIRQKLIEKHQKENGGGGITLPTLGGQQNNNIPMGGAFPTLQQSATMLDDGTLKISAPSWLGNKQYVIQNTMEDEYEKNRNLFIQSIYRDNPRPGGDT